MTGAARLGIGLAAVGRPAYITDGRDRDLGAGADRSVPELESRAHDVLEEAWSLGLRFIDAARSYGRAEAFLGSWLRAHPERRSRLTIESKWGYAYVGGWRMDAEVHEVKEHSTAMLRRQWPETLGALGTTPDRYLVHSLTSDSPAFDDPGLLDALRGLADRGVRVGLSTSGPKQADAVRMALDLPDTPFSVVQSTWNLLESSVGPALAEAADAGWAVVVKEALANGRLLDAEAVPGLAALAADHGLSLDALAIGAALGRPWAETVLSGAVAPEQLRANDTARPLPLDEATLAACAVPAAEYWAARGARPWT
ncbi:aldo/keto reductase [Agromyces seonyuensis]|uniref:Aldo/keto reductase n=1 Tax=Agromyces seonyuensis TaxID=2662446 RepID=A0A6I4P2G2_9MICO|nr:aldo/keto reductase [Agromyces seonyuensis]MWB97477.1 aldo/keto reductase [Agromyces seonyuensis]